MAELSKARIVPNSHPEEIVSGNPRHNDPATSLED